MKLILIVYNISIEEEVQAMLKQQQVSCFTQWPRLLGRGKTAGSRFDSNVWPGANSALMVVTDETAAPRLMAAVEELRRGAGQHEGIKAFQLAVESMTGDI